MRTHTTGQESVEMYLKTIAELSDGRTPVVIARVAERLGVSPVSANEMMQRLDAQELITREPYKGVLLTDHGRYIAHSIIRRQRLWEVFLVEHLKYNWAGAYEAACRLEHATSNVLAESLSIFLGTPTHCPHGNPIPAADGSIAFLDGRPLNTFHTGETGRIQAILPTDTDVFAHLWARHIVPRQMVTVTAVAPLQGPLTLRVNENEVALGPTIAALVIVEPIPPPTG